MSANYTVRQKAQEDVIGIWLYSVEQWGPDQADRYLQKINEKFRWLADNPKAGHLRSDVKQDRYFVPVGSHLILYKLVNNQPDIIRVVHQNADVPQWVNPE